MAMFPSYRNEIFYMRETLAWERLKRRFRWMYGLNVGFFSIFVLGDFSIYFQRLVSSMLIDLKKKQSREFLVCFILRILAFSVAFATESSLKSIT